MSEQRCGEQQRKEAVARIWLSYCDRVLYKKGVITERERNKMEVKINSWKTPSQMFG